MGSPICIISVYTEVWGVEQAGVVRYSVLDVFWSVSEGGLCYVSNGLHKFTAH